MSDKVKGFEKALAELLRSDGDVWLDNKVIQKKGKASPIEMTIEVGADDFFGDYLHADRMCTNYYKVTPEEKPAVSPEKKEKEYELTKAGIESLLSSGYIKEFEEDVDAVGDEVSDALSEGLTSEEKELLNSLQDALKKFARAGGK